MSTPHADDLGRLLGEHGVDARMARGVDGLYTPGAEQVSEPDVEVPRQKIRTPHEGDYAERLPFSIGIALDAGGNFSGPIYTVRSGYRFNPLRVIVLDSRGTFTPAAPYTNAAGWIALHEEDVAPANIAAFVPNPPVASGPIIPAAFVFGEKDSPQIRQSLMLQVVTGPANVILWVNGVGILRES